MSYREAIPKVNQPEYVPSRGLGTFDRLYLKLGFTWISFGGLGGLYGTVLGIKNTPSYKPKILRTSVLNTAKRHAIILGNSAAVLYMYYFTIDHLTYKFNLEKYATNKYEIPIAAGALTGGLYKSMSILSPNI